MRKKNPYIISLLFVSLMCFTASAKAADETLEHLLSLGSKPAPNPPGISFSPIASGSDEHRSIVEHDLQSGEVVHLPRLDTWGATEDDPPFLGRAYTDESFIDQHSNEEMRGGVNPPSPYFDTTNYPFNTVYKLIMRFNVGGTDYYYGCSAWSAGDFHLVTAGHCLYNWDPNDNGNTSDRKWADEVWAWAGQTDKVNPIGCNNYCADHPYGWAKGTYQRAYTGWTVSQNEDHDFAVLTLDRDMGDRTGWMGRSDIVPSSVNFTGYPTETPYVPADTNVQYYGFDSGNVVAVTDYRIQLSAFVYGGHSGGPSWKYTNGTRWAVGIHSTSNRVGSAYDTLLTDTKRADINSWISTDATVRPTADKPDVTESLFDGLPHKSIDKSVVGHLEDIQVDFEILNAGFAGTGDIFIAFYASTNYYVSTSDELLEIKTLPGISSPWASRAYSETVNIDSDLPADDYTIGWFMSTAGEYPGDVDCGSGAPCSNLVSIYGQTLTVDDCTVDLYESDGNVGDATTLATGVAQDHSICATGDEDWYTFTLGNPSSAVLETSGTTGDTTMFLLNEPLTVVIEADANGGSGNFSRIDRECGFDELPAGTYKVKVVGSGIVHDYQMSLTSAACNSDDIFADGFESGDTSAWSTVAL